MDWIPLNYTFTLRHKAEVENKATDALSRHIFILTKMSTVVNGFEKIKAEYKLCPNFYDIYAILIDGSTQEVDGYTLHDGYLFLGRKLCIPRASLREFLVWELHAGGLAGHFGNEKTIEAVEYRFYWPGWNVTLPNMLEGVKPVNSQSKKTEHWFVHSTTSPKLPMAEC